MKKLEVPFLSVSNPATPVAVLSEKLNKLQKNAIDNIPWPEYDYKPQVSFALAHSNDSLLIKYFVEEHAIRAVHRNANDPVYKDSCVECFISFGEEESYYNLEFNSLGTCLTGFGPDRHNRALIPESVTRNIRRHATLTIMPESEASPTVKWELFLQIPAEVFCFHQISTLKHQRCRVNFYKCGDDLPSPHFLTWNKIESQEPNFHLPQFFGCLHFN